MKLVTNIILFTSPQTQPARKPRKTMSLALRQRHLYGKSSRNNTGEELDPETGLYYFGARYLDPKTSRWLSGDPAVFEYIPVAPVNDEARKRNGSLPGMGGVFNYVNLHVYHYAGNNPVKLKDPDGRSNRTTIIVSTGHGMDRPGSDPGAVVDGYKEINFTYRFSDKLYTAMNQISLSYVNLKAHIENSTGDHTVAGKVSASNEIYASRDDISLHLSIHADAGTAGYEGISIYYIAGAERSRRIADYFSEKLTAEGFEVRVRPDTSTRPGSLGELRQTTAPALLIEIGSLDTASSRRAMNERMDVLATALAETLRTFNIDRPNQ